VSFDEHLRAKRNRQHERDRCGRRGELCSNGSGDTDQRNACEKEAAPARSDRRPGGALPKLAASHEELDCSPADHAEADGRERTQNEQYGRGDAKRKVLRRVGQQDNAVDAQCDWKEQRALSEPIGSPLAHDEEDDHRETTEDIDRLLLQSAHDALF
jgi:hypothetical protein